LSGRHRGARSAPLNGAWILASRQNDERRHVADRARDLDVVILDRREAM
jgi:hypothetical protein